MTESKESVLIVEDDQMVLDLLKEWVEKIGFSVHTALNGLEGLRKIKLENYSYILTDLDMPTMRGDEFIKEVCAYMGSQRPTIFLVTGLLRSLSGEKTILNVDGVLQKPFVADDLVKLFHSHQSSKNVP